MWEPQPLATLRASTACTEIILPYSLKHPQNPDEQNAPPIYVIISGDILGENYSTSVGHFLHSFGDVRI
jgi:hypothetical protein